MTGIIERVEGFVKMYSPRDGYGFLEPITPLDPPGDVLVHRGVVEAFGQPLVCDARVVVGDAVHVPGKGWRATRVISQVLPQLYQTGAWFPATVQWHNPEKGYGFAKLDATGQEVMMHSAIYRASIGVPTSEQAKGLRIRVKLEVRQGYGLRASHVQMNFQATKKTV